MSNDVSEHFNRDVLGVAQHQDAAPVDMPESFIRETLGVVHPGHEAVVQLDPDYFAALQNYYSTWTISRKDAAIPRSVIEFIIIAVLLTQGKLHGARVHVRRALLAGATPREVFQAITAAAVPGGVPVVWHGAAMVRSEMEALGLGLDGRRKDGETQAVS